MDRRLLSYTCIAAFCLALLNGCADSAPHLQMYKLDGGTETCTIGILPIVNNSEFNQGDKLLYRIILTQLIEQQIGRVALEGDLLAIYRELHIKPWTQPRPEQLQIIASRLDVDILIGGEILDMREPVEGTYLNPHISIQLQVYSGQSGTIQWSTYHKRQGTDYRKIMHFGLNNTVSQLGNTMIEEILHLWKEEALLRCQN